MKTHLRTHLVPALKDNYAYIIEDIETKQALVVDPSEFGPVSAQLKALNLNLKTVLNTHHHIDHVGGNLELKETYRCEIFCSAYDKPRIEGADRGLREGEFFAFGHDTVHIIEIPGHTLGHIAFYFEKSGFVFSGDTLFSAGCGRLFEGTPTQMFASLAKLAALPMATQVFCGHEYTLANLKFAKVIEPQNEAVRIEFERAQALRAQNQPTIPSTIEREKKMNVFLRADSTSRLGEIRKLKDDF